MPLRGFRRTQASAALLLAALLAPASARATAFDFVPVGDPLEAELRILDLLDPVDRPPFALRRLHARPIQVFEIPADTGATRVASRIAFRRLERFAARDLPERNPGGAGTTPRLFQIAPETGAAVEASAGLEGAATFEDDSTAYARGTGAHLRGAVMFDRWLAYSHVVFGYFPDAASFADPLVKNTDVIVHTEESYLAWTAESGRWAAQFGRSRWHWGPGEEGSLMLSKTAPPLTGLALRGSVPSVHLDLLVLNATISPAAGEQLAAHRIEWQPLDRLRLGLSEAARYHSGGWDPLYAVGVVPYVLIQRIEVEDEPDSVATLRNNVLLGVDAAWRIADGTRVYGELLVDDLHASTNDNPDKIGVLVGLEGAGTALGRRVSWGTEFTRISRWVYSSFFGRAYESRGQPLGFPTGPDSRRIRVRAALDLDERWQLFGTVAQTDHGENTIDDPFVPGTPADDPWTFQGVIERTLDVEAGARWWPASGVDVAVRGGWRKIEDQGHVPGIADDNYRGEVILRLIR